MKKERARRKDKKAIFICQVTENSLKVVKCGLKSKLKKEFSAFEVEALSPGESDKLLSEKARLIFQKLQYYNNPVIVSISRQQATCRYIKIPAQSPQEIERIISFQASKYLPYPVNELVTGYQTIMTNKEGYSHVNLCIVHKDVVARYLEVFKSAGAKDITITLSSYGLSILHNTVVPKEAGPVLVIDIDSAHVELAVISHDRFLFSRSFRILKQQALEQVMLEEINKTTSAYLKETDNAPITRIIIFGSSQREQKLAQNLGEALRMPVEAVSYCSKVSCSADFLNAIENADCSFASLVGIGLGSIPESLNFLPLDVKETRKKATASGERLRTAFLLLVTILILGLGINRSLSNKRSYLTGLRTQLSEAAKEAKGLEALEKRIALAQNSPQKNISLVEIIYELHKITPSDITLVNLNYEESGELILQGRTTELNSVFGFATALEGIEALRNFEVKVKYATKKRTRAGEIVDFEIACVKEK
ncbi:MAG: pilus assembly protein PilM [Candidatus Omnitrophica bacterium]|nr:pilus assembly protein PilM [Candidatus Omnitrophota bacterium]